MSAVGDWLYRVLGLSGSGVWYAWWSAAGSDWGQVTVLVGVVVGIRKLQCHTPRCWRLGHHEAAGGTFKLCRRHHPDVPTRGLTREVIESAHTAYKEQTGG